ncbi:hypothetical protein [Lachnobacterium bovis]|uniref:hypothetical protein n=1 Tax=Lachnobacterium bovis TaxID=140626 RepID=UPI00048AB466|nr:hypothetical protein [Lachnobacterium bovis]
MGLFEPVEHRADFSISEDDFKKLSDWYMSHSEKRELLGNTNHLLYICKKVMIIQICYPIEILLINLEAVLFLQILNHISTVQCQQFREQHVFRCI